MVPRSCLKDMAWKHSGTTKIGEYQVAGTGRPVGLSQSVTVTRQNRVLLLQIETFLSTPPQQSKSVTARPTFGLHLLQIETNQTRLLENLNL